MAGEDGPLEVVWLSRDVRLHDHAALHSALSKARGRGASVLLLFVYDPEQLACHCFHEAHLKFINDGLVDVNQQLEALGCRGVCCAVGSPVAVLEQLAAATGRALRLHSHRNINNAQQRRRRDEVLAHCATRAIEWLEFAQSGVTFGLDDRDNFSALWNAYMRAPQLPAYNAATMSAEDLPLLPAAQARAPPPEALCHALCDPRELLRGASGGGGARLCTGVLDAEGLRSLGAPVTHRGVRVEAQAGGERRALGTLRTFLGRRARGYSGGISSPNSSWTSCARLSAYLAWGHISLRSVVQATWAAQERRRAEKKARGAGAGAGAGAGGGGGSWLKSLAAFQSRLRWRSHFMQKFEDEPSMEHEDVVAAFRGLRRQPGDWNEEHYDAWASGNTGFPLVDACMRCLERSGWLNFRMRAMVVSFAVHNLHLDWVRITPLLARLFLDYEPGIHYAQVQMQSATTGINAIRVYDVVKQQRDQDPQGTFVRKYVPELRGLPPALLAEPPPTESYPGPIVDAKATAKRSRDAIAAIRRTDAARAQAARVLKKHGSRKRTGAKGREGAGARAPKRPAAASVVDLLLKGGTAEEPLEV